MKDFGSFGVLYKRVVTLPVVVRLLMHLHFDFDALVDGLNHDASVPRSILQRRHGHSRISAHRALDTHRRCCPENWTAYRSVDPGNPYLASGRRSSVSACSFVSPVADA